MKLKEIDKEDWRFVLYENSDKRWIVDFVYSPISFVDLSMLILLSDSEKDKAKDNRNFLIEFSDKVRNNPEKYLKRSLKMDEYEFISDSTV